VVIFTPGPLYIPGKSHWYNLDTRLGGSQNRSGHGGEEKNPLPCRESNPDLPACSLVSILKVEKNEVEAGVSCHSYGTTERIGAAVMPHTCILGVPGSNLIQAISYPD